MTMSMICYSLSLLFVLVPQFTRCQSHDGYHKEKDYDGYKVLRVQPQTTDQLLYLQQFWEDKDSAGTNINFWSKPSAINSTADVMVAPSLETEVKNMFKEHHIKTETLINDVGR